MSRRLTIGLHDGGRIVMQADGPEAAMAFDGFGELLCRKPEAADGTGIPDVEFVVPGRCRTGVM